MTIRTNPPGAIVYVDDYEIGATQVSTNFVHYGTRRVRIAKDGYETLTVEQPIPAPWYQVPPLDFVSETLIPWEIRDHRTLNYQLAPQRVVPPDQLRARAEDLRARANASSVAQPAIPLTPRPVVPPPATAPPATAPPAAAAPPMTRPAAPPAASRGAYPYQAPAAGSPTLPPGVLPPSASPRDAGPQTLPPGGMPLR